MPFKKFDMMVPSSPYADIQREGRIRVAILGSTGSIGKSALQVIRDHKDKFEVVALAAGTRVEELEQQVREFKPKLCALGALPEGKAIPTHLSEAKLLRGEKGLEEIATHPSVDVVLASVVGVSGLRSVLSAVKAGKRVALANKESIVASGALVKKAQSESGSIIIPVDSEHSAIFQSLMGDRASHVSSFILTASGGPFLNTPLSDLKAITPAQAVKHPRWSMGAKISIDSATLVNKALELIEAHFLFGATEESIQVIVHPESIVHSLVEYQDGSQIAQLSVPDMRGAIAYALNWPEGRLTRVMERLDLTKLGSLHFLPLDHLRFPAVSLARAAVRDGGACPAIFNIANEVAVERFLSGAITFDRIVPLISESLEYFGSKGYNSLEELLEIHAEVRARIVSQHS